MTEYSGVINRNSSGAWINVPSTLPIGALQYFGNANGDSYISPTWLKCDGSILSQATYPTLYDRIGLINPGGTVWEKQTTSISTNLSAIDFSSIFLTVGTNGSAFTSTDGITWTARNTGAGLTAVNCLAHSPTQFFIGGGSGLMLTTTDGITYTSRTSGSSTGINGVAFGNSTYVYVGNGGTAGSSTDGTTWVVRKPTSTTHYNSLAFGNGTFAAVGNIGRLMTSTDGTLWSTRNPNVGMNSSGQPQQAITSGGGLYLSCAWTGIVNTSTDGISWTTQTIATTSSLSTCIYGTNYAVAGQGGLLFSSPDGASWTSRTSGTSSTIFCMTYGSVHVYAGAGGTAATSTDCITWTSRTSGTTSAIYALIHDTQYMYAGVGGTLATSTDAITWNARTSGTASTIYTLTSGGGIYVYGGNGGVLASSTDGITWTQRTSGTAAQITSLTYGNGKFVYAAPGVSGTSTDGTTWVSSGPINISSFPSLTTIGSTYYSWGYNSGGYSSSDGLVWNLLPGSPTISVISSITYQNNKFVMAYGSSVDQFLATSTDAQVFTEIDTTTATINSGVYGNGTYMVVGNSGSVYTSTDGTSWNATPSGTATNLQGVSYGASCFVAVGIGIWRSSDTYSYNTGTQFQLPTDAAVNGELTTEYTSNFKRSLYIKAS